MHFLDIIKTLFDHDKHWNIILYSKKNVLKCSQNRIPIKNSGFEKYNVIFTIIIILYIISV